MFYGEMTKLFQLAINTLLYHIGQAAIENALNNQ